MQRTNVLVRLIRRDDAEQAAAAERYIEMGAWVSTLALADAVWVLGTAYGRSPKELARIVEMLPGNGRLVIQDAVSIEDALVMFKAHPSIGFSDRLFGLPADRLGSKRRAYAFGDFRQEALETTRRGEAPGRALLGGAAGEGGDSSETPIIVDGEFKGKQRKMVLHANRADDSRCYKRLAGSRDARAAE